MNISQMKQYFYLMRLHKPVGIVLLLWPTLWALWLAGNGAPNWQIVIIFILGVVLMRSAGCIINDFADRNFDAHVARTRERPLATGKIPVLSALVLFGILMLCAFLLVLTLNRFTIVLAFIGAFLAIFYPFMKRFTHLPQLGLGVAFAWAVPMAFAALTNSIGMNGWLVFLAAALWPVIYDTMYAMVDRSDDMKIGIKSTAILLGQQDKMILAFMQILLLGVLIAIGYVFQLQYIYFLSLFLVVGLFIYQQWLIKDRQEQRCFQAFLNNQWIGLVVFMGIILSYLL